MALASRTIEQVTVNPSDTLARQVENLQTLIESPPENSRTITFSPELAAWILEHNNEGNRKIKPSRIRRYAEAMDSGKWLLTGETIIFAIGGRLLDGQNRLLACVRTGKPFTSYVVFGIKENVFVAINTASARTPGDMFHTSRVQFPQTVSQAVRWLINADEEGSNRRTSHSNDALWQFYKNEIKVSKLQRIISRVNKLPKTIPHGALVAHFYLFYEKDEDVAAAMMRDFEGKKNGPVGPAKRLLDFIARKRKANGGRLNDVWINALLIRTWNAYRAGNPKAAMDSVLRYTIEQQFPTIQ